MVTTLLVMAIETPPRMRGRLDALNNRFGVPGNTPAYAGKTCTMCIKIFSGQKHPRVCGEDDPGRISNQDQRETPPRMRGRLFIYHIIAEGTGNTPAYAGKTLCIGLHDKEREKHPRVCGEDLPSRPKSLPIPETPPRMRGRLRRRSSCARLIRNTPAYAGKTIHGG